MDNLAKNLAPANMSHIREHFAEDKKFLLATRKGVFSYQYTGSYDKLSETTLPTKDRFVNCSTNIQMTLITYMRNLFGMSLIVKIYTNTQIYI